MRQLHCLAMFALLAGCTLDFGDDGDDQCLRGLSDEGAFAPVPQLLNPQTLRCESFGYCDPACGNCPPPEPIPSWAYCGEACEGLGERQCLDATACRAVYEYTLTGCMCQPPFVGCYGVDMTGPIQGACTGLDALECSKHNDCIALHMPQCSGDMTDCWQEFIECQDELTCYGPVTCAAPTPVCAPGSVPAVKDGCYTGACILVGDCEPQL